MYQIIKEMVTEMSLVRNEILIINFNWNCQHVNYIWWAWNHAWNEGFFYV